ncbi:MULTISPECIES: helix-hairpin-helix domain-containing protein [Niastella]|uniref:Mitomycin resistance protein mcrB n=1 Tax=Niastella soli TaxID=2821487 RepID=A0ABS3YVN6_9BACT|nr:helix-hairpin-helix domain-containing protein [Niastella soli]MBO9201975.1 Mitomycin resistance protein mcrB [Niastella soli]
MTTAQSIKELSKIPGVGKSIATDLLNIGISRIDDLKGKDPQQLYDQSNQFAGCVQDRCILYVFRCAVYYAETPARDQESGKLKWWNWKDKKI